MNFNFYGKKTAMDLDAKRIKTYRTAYPTTKFVGKRYGEKDKKDGTYGHLWDEWFNENRFAPLESQIPDPSFVEDGDAYYGMCRILADGTDEYWIGMIMPENTEIPEGYNAFMIPACEAVVNWIYGKEPDVYFCDCRKEMADLGHEWKPLSSGDLLMAERYVCPRFTEPDENGKLILDQVYFTAD